MLDTEHEMNRLTVATYVKNRVPFIALVLAASLIIATVADGTSKYVVVEIAYCDTAKQFTVYYHQDGETIPSPGIIPIAKIDAGTEVFKVPGSVKVMIEIAK